MKLMTLKSKKFTRPVVTPFEEEVDPVGLARTVAKEYRVMEDGHHSQLRAFLGRAYLVYRLFRQAPSSYEELKRDPFWEKSRQKPKGLTTSRWVLLYLMRAERPNVRTRASKYAKIIDGFARAGVRADRVPGRIKGLGGVEDAYAHFLAAERGLRSTVARHDETTQDQHLAIRRKGGLRAFRGSNDDKVQGDVEAESTSENLGAAIGGRRRMPSLDPERCIIVDLEPDEVQVIRAAGTTKGSPVTFRLEITVHHPHDAKGFVHAVGELEPSDPPPDLSSIDLEDDSFETSTFDE
jgi:hypothetical protein